MFEEKREKMRPKEVMIPPSPVLLVLLKNLFVYFEVFFKDYLLIPVGTGHGGVYAGNPST